MTRKIAKTLDQLAQYQFEDALTISSLMNKIEDDSNNNKAIKKELGELKSNVKEILGLLRNDNTTNTKGLVEQTRDNDKRLDVLEKYKGEFIARMGVLGLIMAGIFNFIFWLISNFKVNR